MQEIQAQEYFKQSYSKVRQFHDEFVKEGDLRGLIGPREVPRLWERHILNSATLQDFMTTSVDNLQKTILVDVGSGTGFPGVVLACMFPDVRVYLVEAMSRRVDWLLHIQELLKLENAEVVRGRAEDIQRSMLIPPADFVSARAVANLKKLLPWTMPFLKPGGQLLALKGASVEDEVGDAVDVIKQYSNAAPEILKGASIPGVETTTILKLTRK
ncbi:MAG: 16S rRNA (guanine(527)-N(7))-methyltransferase RsmG [Candidatus Ancillula trichonymphae]|jgi:16S rRNA (guanine527-N7)-methyltransferase|nr:16S rRNA (guanine(527)-N(7))-methyltransferase RsmG [Candidatus Ancillula trichonymphae]